MAISSWRLLANQRRVTINAAVTPNAILSDHAADGSRLLAVALAFNEAQQRCPIIAVGSATGQQSRQTGFLFPPFLSHLRE
jgi:hypothetical protein